MHDLDRSDLVLEANDIESALDEYGEIDELGEIDEPREIGERGGPDEVGELDEPGEPDAEDGLFDEIEQAELAGELLATTDDDELERFFGRLIKKGRRALHSTTARRLRGLLKDAARTALKHGAPIAGAAIGGPMGATLAGKAASSLGSMLGMELEGLSPEDQELEAAKQVVRLAGAAIEHAADLEPSTSSESAAYQGMVNAARRHAPGLLRRHATHTLGRAQRGTWVRRGGNIVLFGA
jgi:hypothetical protein